MAIAYATVTFAAASTGAATWTGITNSTPKIEGGATVTDAGPAVEVWFTAVTNSGCTVNASDVFTGSVTLTIED